eukprot:Gb_14513 [translate_table: standard]
MCLDEERSSLLAFKDPYFRSNPRLSSWKGFNCCQWEGVHCDRHSSHVVQLHLHNSLPSLSNPNVELFELKHLEYLDLSSNHLIGALPEGAEAFGSHLEFFLCEYTRGTWLSKRVESPGRVLCWLLW